LNPALQPKVRSDFFIFDFIKSPVLAELDDTNKEHFIWALHFQLHFKGLFLIDSSNVICRDSPAIAKLDEKK
jgi:hypothetical protein